MSIYARQSINEQAPQQETQKMVAPHCRPTMLGWPVSVPTDGRPASIQLVVQRYTAGRQSPLQRKADFAYLQRTIGNRAMIQMEDALQRQDDTAAIHEAARAGVQGSGSKLPHFEKIQQSFGGHDISHIQAFTGGRAAAASQAIGAQAYTTGNKIAFAGSPNLHTAAHEAAHTIQQQAGVQLEGGVGQVGDRYEQHADAVANQVVKGQSAEGLLSRQIGAQPYASNDDGGITQNKLNVQDQDQGLMVGPGSSEMPHRPGLSLSRTAANDSLITDDGVQRYAINKTTGRRRPLMLMRSNRGNRGRGNNRTSRQVVQLNGKKIRKGLKKGLKTGLQNAWGNKGEVALGVLLLLESAIHITKGSLLLGGGSAVTPLYGVGAPIVGLGSIDLALGLTKIIRAILLFSAALLKNEGKGKIVRNGLTLARQIIWGFEIGLTVLSTVLGAVLGDPMAALKIAGTVLKIVALVSKLIRTVLGVVTESIIAVLSIVEAKGVKVDKLKGMIGTWKKILAFINAGLVALEVLLNGLGGALTFNWGRVVVNFGKAVRAVILITKAVQGIKKGYNLDEAEFDDDPITTALDRVRVSEGTDEALFT